LQRPFLVEVVMVVDIMAVVTEVDMVPPNIMVDMEAIKAVMVIMVADMVITVVMVMDPDGVMAQPLLVQA
jgi:hypothetical protein